MGFNAPWNETFSYRHWPCRFEHTAESVIEARRCRDEGRPVKTMPCPFRAYCDESAGALSLLEVVYGRDIKVTLAEPSATIMVRSEHQFNHEERLRLSLRKHIHEFVPARRDGQPCGGDFTLSAASIRSLEPMIQRERARQIEGIAEKLKPLTETTFPDEETFQEKLARIPPYDQLRSVHGADLAMRLRPGPSGGFVLPLEGLRAFQDELARDVPQSANRLARSLEERIASQRFPTEGAFKEAIAKVEGFSPFDEWLLMDNLIEHAGIALNCRRIHKEDRFGRYLGFVDLRLNSPSAPLALGALALPRHCLNAPDYQFVTGEYGTAFGGPGFPCTVYVMHDPQTGGAHCAQCAVVMSLAALADRGARLTGSFTLTYLAHEPSATRVQSNPHNRECLRNLPPPRGGSERRSFQIDGLNGEQIRDVLERHEVSPSLIRLKQTEYATTQRRVLAHRLTEAYVEARFPVIYLVHTKQWWAFQDHQENPHAITVIGVHRGRGHREEDTPLRHDPRARNPRERRSQPDREEDTLLCHDPGYLPYVERPFSDYIEAAERYVETGSVQLIAAADRGLSVHAIDCIAWLNTYFKKKGGFLNRYSPDDQGTSGKDYRISLVHRDDLIKKIFPESRPPMRRQGYKVLHRVLDENTRRTRYWCVSTQGTDSPAHWLFDADRLETPDAEKRQALDDATRVEALGRPILRIVKSSPFNGHIQIFAPDPMADDFPVAKPFDIQPHNPSR